MTKWERFYYGLFAVALIIGAAALEGCSTVKTIYDACRQGDCR